MVGDEEPPTNDDDGDEVAEDVITSNAVVTEDIISEAQLSEHLVALSAEDAKLGCLAIAKVCSFSFSNHISVSYPL